MPDRTLEHNACRKHGFILICYVNGKKRFRAQAFARPPVDFNIAPHASPRHDAPPGRAGAIGL
jgi:hypothetical protein